MFLEKNLYFLEEVPGISNYPLDVILVLFPFKEVHVIYMQFQYLGTDKRECLFWFTYLFLGSWSPAS